MALTAALTRKHTPVNMYTPVLQPPSLGVTHRPGALVVHTGLQLLFGLTSDEPPAQLRGGVAGDVPFSPHFAPSLPTALALQVRAPQLRYVCGT